MDTMTKQLVARSLLQAASALEAAAKLPKVTFGKFNVLDEELATADILVDGVKVGIITRRRADLLRSPTGYARHWVVVAYEATLDDANDTSAFEDGELEEHLRLNRYRTETVGRTAPEALQDLKDTLSDYYIRKAR